MCFIVSFSIIYPVMGPAQRDWWILERGATALLHWRASGAICPNRLAVSSGEAEKSIHKTHFSSRTRFLQKTLPLADHAHDLKAFDRR
jgi:hypothetical protein